jgi:exopolysaccharide production protein ExoQ
LSEPEPQFRRAVISWQEVRAWGRGGEAPPAEASARGWRRIDIDGVFAFALFIPVLFAGDLGQPLAGEVFGGLLLAYAALRWRRLLKILGPRLFLLIPAILAIASAAWSDQPTQTLWQGGALMVTLLAALLLSAAASPGAVFSGVTGAYLLYLIAARAQGLTMLGGMGDIGATAVIVSLGAAAMALRQRNWALGAIGTVAAGFEISALAQARPAGAVLGIAVALAVMVALVLTRASRTWLRLVATILVGGGALAAGLFGRRIAEAMTEFGRGWIAGNPSLIKPSDVWAQARTSIADQRWLGHGFYGQWSIEPAGAATAAALGPAPVHNSYIDILVQLGWVGLWIVGATLIIAILAFAWRYVRRPNLALCFWAGLLVYELVRIQVDVVGYAPFSASAILLTAALAAAFSPAMPERPARKTARAEAPVASVVVHLGEYRARKTEKADPAFRHPDQPS